MIAPPLPPLRIGHGDEGHLARLKRRMWQVNLSAAIVVATAWCFTLGSIPGIIALVVAKHLLVAILAMGLGVDAPVDDAMQEDSVS